MDTEGLMRLALDMSGLKEVPADSEVFLQGRGIERVLIGIDIGEGELLLAERMGFDCAIAHHPAGGSSRVRFHEVIARHQEMLEAHGVPSIAAAEAVEELTLQRDLVGHASNYDRVPSIARLLRIPFMSIHTPLDEIGRQRMVGRLETCDPGASVRDALEVLGTFGEFRRALTRIEIRHGDGDNPLGRWAVAHGAGTNGGYPVAKAYFSHGIDTLLYIHISPADLERLRKDSDLAEKNLIVTGHIASDSLGINPYVDRLRQEGIEVTCIGGIIEP
ncbi:MAG: hypothetical protein V3U52_08490 [Thermoplasmata archaeon]